MKHKHLLPILLLLVLVASIFPALSATPEIDPAISNLQSKLATLTSSHDSLKILYDIFDLSPQKYKSAVGKEIYEVAERSGDISAQLDILRQNHNNYSDLNNLIRLEKMAAALPKSREQIETVLFMRMHRLSYEVNILDQNEQLGMLSDLVKKLNVQPHAKQNPYDRLYNLYAVVILMRNHADSKVMTEYLDSLVSMVHRNDYELYALRNVVYAEASRIYSDAGMSKQAIASARQLLKVIDGLQKKYESQGRKYRNFNVSRYVVYRRMLRNYKALTPAEVEDVHKKIIALASTDPSIASDARSPENVESYYLMAKGKYADAIPVIKEALTKKTPLARQRQLYEMLQSAARQIGDSTTLVTALEGYNRIIANMDSLDASMKYKELQVAYDVSQLREHNYRLRLEKAENETSELRSKMSMVMATWIIIAILLVILLFYYTRYHSSTTMLSKFAAKMASQRDALKSNRFSDFNKEAYKSEKLLHTHDTRTLIRSVISDILYISAIGHDDRQRHIETVSASAVLRAVVSMSEKRDKDWPAPNVTYPDPDFKLRTDLECLEYVLTQICDFARSHAVDDNVTISIYHAENATLSHFVFTHSGERIKRGAEESLFHNFINWDELNSREDSTLFICRLNAFLLQSSLSYNPHPDGPAKLILTVPIHPNNL